MLPVIQSACRAKLTDAIQRFCKEVVTWKTLRHPNILPLMGVMMTDTQFGMVSEWMANGNINEFVKAHRNADRFGLVGVFLSSRFFLGSINDDRVTPSAGRCC